MPEYIHLRTRVTDLSHPGNTLWVSRETRYPRAGWRDACHDPAGAASGGRRGVPSTTTSPGWKPSPEKRFGCTAQPLGTSSTNTPFFRSDLSLFLSLSLFCMNHTTVFLITRSPRTHPPTHVSATDAWAWKSSVKRTGLVGDTLRGRLHRHPGCPRSTDDKPRSGEGTSHVSLRESQPITQGPLNQPGPVPTLVRWKTEMCRRSCEGLTS